MEEKNRYGGNTALNKQCNWTHICEFMLFKWLHLMLSRDHNLRSESTSDSWAQGPVASHGFALLCGWMWVIWDGSLSHTCRRMLPSILLMEQGQLLEFYCKKFLELSKHLPKTWRLLYGLKTLLTTWIKSHHKKIIFCVRKGNCSIETAGTCHKTNS